MAIIDKPTPAHRAMLEAMLSAFRKLGPVEVLDWFVEYFAGFAAAMSEHGHPAPWCDELVDEVRHLVVKYREKSRS